MSQPVKRLVIFALSMLMMALVWRHLIDNEIISSGKIIHWLQHVADLKNYAWLMPVVILLYILLLSLMFPLTVLVLTTGFLFDPIWAMLCATIGTLFSSALSFYMGHYIGREAIEKHGGERIRKAEAFMQDNALVSMITINLLPIAPFTMTNLLAGAFKICFIPYMVGSAIGIIPGLFAVILVGSQLSKILLATEAAHVWQGIGIALMAIISLAIIIYWVKRRTFSKLNKNKSNKR